MIKIKIEGTDSGYGSEEYYKDVGKTSRASGTTARDKNGAIRAVVPKYVLQNIDKDKTVLDFGAGKDAVQAQILKEEGFKNITAYDGDPRSNEDVIDKNALNKKYDVVYASNVVNVQRSEEEIRQLVKVLYSHAKETCIFNYPSSPRKAGLKTPEIQAIIEDELGCELQRVGGSKADPIWRIDKNSKKTEKCDPFKRKINGTSTTYQRVPKYGVGKPMMGKIYVHKNYADRVVPVDTLNRAKEILNRDFPDFKYNCICYNPKVETVVRFDESPDFDTTPEPEVSRYINVDIAANNGQGSSKMGTSHAIWHHKWMWVDDDYKGFDVEDSYNWSQEWTKKISKPSGIRDEWNQLLADNDLEDGKY